MLNNSESDNDQRRDRATLDDVELIRPEWGARDL